MTVEMPDPIPLEMPPGDPAALADLVQDLAGAAFRLAALEDQLTGPGATAPGWVGDDAVAATAQVDVVAWLARDCAAAVRTGSGRLRAHSDVVENARRGVAALSVEQDEDFRAAWRRIQQIPDLHLTVMTGGAGWVGVTEELEAAEASRHRRHAALLDEVADDAAATARVLVESCAVVGGRGAPGDEARVVVHLAGQLPGWGYAELTARARDLADALEGDVSDGERNELAHEARAFADAGSFAGTFLSRLGVDGVGELLRRLGEGWFGDDMAGEVSPMARLLATTLGAARPRGTAHDPVGEVLTGAYVHADDESFEPDMVALGMAAVLAVQSAAPPTDTVARWGRQLLAREHAQAGSPAGARAIDRVFSQVQVSMDRFDPVTRAVASLARRDDPASAAFLLNGPSAWEVLLGRAWVDGGAALGDLITRAAQDEGPAGQSAVRSGLAALGAGLADHDPDDWAVDRGTAAGVAPALGAAVAVHVPVAVEALWVGVDGRLGDAADGVRGLGYVTLDRGAAAAVERGLHDWARAQSVALEGTGPLAPLPAVAVPSAYIAVQEYGQRLAHALHGFEEQQAAERRQRLWDLLVGLPLSFAKGPLSGLSVVEGYAAIVFDMDGTWENGVDRGLRFDDDDAASAVLAQLPPGRVADAEAVDRQARAAYERTVTALGMPTAPTPPETDYLEPLTDAVMGSAGELVQRRVPGPGPR